VTAAARFKEDLSLDSLDVVEVRSEGGREGGRGWVSSCVYSLIDVLIPWTHPSFPPSLPPALGGNGDRGGVCFGDS